MARFNPMTPSGFSMYTMSSMLQKSIRRGDINHAAFAAKELFGPYNNYLWKRLFIISAEDCYGVITKEIVGLRLAENEVSKGKKGYDRDDIFVCKAIVLLCLARKNRDACYTACNFMHYDKLLTLDEIPYDLDFDDVGAMKAEDVPEWVFDIHTLEGRKKGKTDLDMTIDEENALYPHQLSLFDNASWGPYYDREIKRGNIGMREQRAVREFQNGRESDPTHGGDVWPEHDEVWGKIENGGVVIDDPDFNIPD